MTTWCELARHWSLLPLQDIHRLWTTLLVYETIRCSCTYRIYTIKTYGIIKTTIRNMITVMMNIWRLPYPQLYKKNESLLFEIKVKNAVYSEFCVLIFPNNNVSWQYCFRWHHSCLQFGTDFNDIKMIQAGTWRYSVQKMCGFIEFIKNQRIVYQVETVTLTAFKWVIIYNEIRFFTVACEDMHSFVLFLIKY